MEELHNGHIQAQSPLLLYSMLAVAAGFHSDPSIKLCRANWYEQAKLLYDFTGRDPHPALRTIQAVVFLVYHAYTCGDFSACWLYIGKAWRQAAALGMNRMDSEHAVVMPVGLKDGADEERRGYYNRVEWKGKTVRFVSNLATRLTYMVAGNRKRGMSTSAMDTILHGQESIMAYRLAQRD
jgi:hypothetical protein